MNMPAWLKEAIFYESYPQSFYDSNGDGIGDLPGIVKSSTISRISASTRSGSIPVSIPRSWTRGTT